MLCCRVTGSVIATRKNDKLKGCKFTIVEPLDSLNGVGSFIAIDNIGAGVGETVIVVCGYNAKFAYDAGDMPVDAAIVGIVDEGTY
ncbi:MAG: EutN/CcmL family microcompartment protein [Defluviitaleaceae bacterium]|nr:EutN/CcmL family microcompartment protein [Defluviitaleaceae bacterium]